MKIEDFEKLTKAKMVEYYKTLPKEVNEALIEQLKKEIEDLKVKNVELERYNTELLSKESGKLFEIKIKANKAIQELEKENEDLKNEIETLNCPTISFKDEEDLEGTPLSEDGIPLNELPEDKLIIELHKRNQAHDKLAKKYKKLKKMNKQKK